MKGIALKLALILILVSCKEEKNSITEPKDTTDMTYYENFRPQYHYSPEANWMNDPNGLVYHNGTYHLYFQYHPESTVWGPMHWGHATSKNLKDWQNEPVALAPDSLGYIFSGSAVIDSLNTSGLGTAENPPLVAMFTYHEPKGAEAKTTDFQYQGIAYSLDNGQTFTKYEGNPVVPNTENLVDFRDPKVFWDKQTQKWILILVAGDYAMFYNSDNLIDWTYLSEFGRDRGAHGGVWECPDLFPLTIAETGETKWVLFISINPGAPNGGSGTQYFVGEFDGRTFTSEQKDEKWIDLGRDNYAGITYNNLPEDQRIFIGWMSNWEYGQETPTEAWRSAMTLPRKLELHKTNEYYLSNNPLSDFTEGLEVLTPKTKLESKVLTFTDSSLHQSKIYFEMPKPVVDFELQLSNTKGEHLTVSFDATSQEYTLDRSKSGQISFSEKFALPLMKAPAVFNNDTTAEFAIYMDASSIEFFGDGGMNALTAQFFPNAPYTQFKLKTKAAVSNLSITPIPSIW
ncbi:glycoside hydrolase family 32 protein [Leeuwenhoekiella sp. W20_SRS_FM14]|uniref:glycoside hydrolase family 32 protein n=1 Tax=Leeuwenhoekiella sp. W20_SRS_FM14 TaxID=3240270 RepID=UPI003F98B790